MSNEMFGQFGFNFFDGGVTTVEEPKKEEKKADKANAPKDFSKKVVGPVLCVGSGWAYTYGEEGKRYGVSVVAKALFEAGYTEVAASGMVYTCKENKNILLVKGIGISANDDAEVIPKKVTVATGLVKAEYEAKDFTGKDADEISVRDLTEKYVESYPDFAGCKLKLSRAAKVCVPAFSKKAEIKDDQDYRVWSTEETVVVKGSEIMQLFGSSDYDVEFYISDTGVLFPSYYTKSSAVVSESDLGLKKASSKQAVEKFKLPANIYITAIGQTYENVDSSMFGGKDKVTQEQVIEFLKERHRVFSQSNRKFDVIYDVETNTISVAIMSGKKGGAAVAAPFFMSQATGEVVQNLPLGIFKGFSSGESLRNVSFYMSIPKIPFQIVAGIISDFRRNLNKEDMRQIVYDKVRDEFYVFRPVCQCTKTHIDYVFPKLTKGQVLAMTIHSHNTMPAVFSSTDNEDEVITGLYGVVGRLDRSEPQMRFRASLEGSFTELSLDEIFSFVKGGHVA